MEQGSAASANIMDLNNPGVFFFFFLAPTGSRRETSQAFPKLIVFLGNFCYGQLFAKSSKLWRLESGFTTEAQLEGPMGGVRR